MYKNRNRKINFDDNEGDAFHRGINVDQRLKKRNKCKYSILYLHLFRGYDF
jgi:hypothetical protein